MKKTNSVVISKHAVIGAGLAGLACANRLQTANQTVAVFEKARGTGGRLSSRHRLNATFDLGCQQLNASTHQFSQQLELWQNKGWVASHDQRTFYGLPRMSGLTRQLSNNLQLHLSTRIVQLHKKADGWWLEDDSAAQHGPFQQVTLALPVAQALPLLAEHSLELTQQLEKAEHSPSWVAYFTLPKAIAVAASPKIDNNTSQPLHRWTLLNNKPAQQGALQKWVVEASTAWTQQHLDLTSAAAADKLFALWCNAAALEIPPQPLLLEAHRWLYAFTAKSLDVAYLQDLSQGLSVCGDYLSGRSEEGLSEGLENQAEAAWLSGDKLGKKLTKVMQ